MRGHSQKLGVEIRNYRARIFIMREARRTPAEVADVTRWRTGVPPRGRAVSEACPRPSGGCPTPSPVPRSRSLSPIPPAPVQANSALQRNQCVQSVTNTQRARECSVHGGKASDCGLEPTRGRRRRARRRRPPSDTRITVLWAMAGCLRVREQFTVPIGGTVNDLLRSIASLTQYPWCERSEGRAGVT